MKKQSLMGLIGVTFATMMLCSVFLSGCGFFGDGDDNNIYYQPGEHPFTVSAPYVISLGNIIKWDACKNADEYLIFQDNVKILTTSETQIEIEDTSVDHTYTVIARNIKSNVESEESNIALVSKSFGFDQNEILELDPQNIGTYYTISQSRVVNNTFNGIGLLDGEDKYGDPWTRNIGGISASSAVVTFSSSFTYGNTMKTILSLDTGESSDPTGSAVGFSKTNQSAIFINCATGINELEAGTTDEFATAALENITQCYVTQDIYGNEQQLTIINESDDSYRF